MFKLIFEFYERKLINNLSKLSLMELLKQSKNNEYFFPYNIWKKIFDKNSIEGGKKVSWFAVRQLEKFDNIHEFQKLKEIIEDERSDERLVNRIYFTLGNLSKNSKNKEVFDYLLSKLNIESEENITDILISITDCLKPAFYDLNNIYNLIRNGNLQIKTDAVISLKNSESKDSENLLIERFMIEKNKHLKSMIASTLSNIGTSNSIPMLSEELKIAKGVDYRYFLENAINEISSK